MNDSFSELNTLIDYVDDLSNFLSFIGDSIKTLPQQITGYWSVYLIAIIVVGLFAIIIRLVS